MSDTNNIIDEYSDKVCKVADETINKLEEAIEREAIYNDEHKYMKDVIAALIKLSPYNQRILRKVFDLSIHKNKYVRLVVARKLKDLYCRELFNLLVTMLDDKEYDVRVEALSSLAGCQYYFY